MKLFYLFVVLIISLTASGTAIKGIPDSDADFPSDDITPGIEKILKDWAEAYLHKVPDSYSDILNFHLQDDDSYWFIIFENNTFIFNEGQNPDARIIFTGKLETYRKIYTHELNAMTAIGRASIQESAPLDILLKNDMSADKINWERMYFILVNFFNTHPNNKVYIGEKHTRKVHGGNVVALYYSVGFRSACYHIEKGDILNEDGEKDPFNQSFIIISGSGYAKIASDTIELKANEAYFIRPNLEHKVWSSSEEGLTLIWNAWGSEAW